MVYCIDAVEKPTQELPWAVVPEIPSIGEEAFPTMNGADVPGSNTAPEVLVAVRVTPVPAVDSVTPLTVIEDVPDVMVPVVVPPIVPPFPFVESAKVDALVTFVATPL